MPQEAPKRPPKGHREASKSPQNGPQQAPKRTPRASGTASKDLPRDPNEPFRCFHEEPQTPPGQLQERSRASKDGSKTIPDGLKTALEAAKMVKMAPG